MIIVRLIGGLGNQLFQYSVGRNLATIHDTELKFDVTGFDKYPLRTYGLGVFQIRESFATPQEIMAVSGKAQRTVHRICRRLGLPASFLRGSYVKEREPGFDPKILRLPDNVYLDGYWQSEQYFSTIAPRIRRDLTVAAPARGKNLELAKAIQKCTSVSVHIRRGDYVSNPQATRFHGVCDIDYYYRCTSAISKICQHPHFFVFSDDPTWARENFRPPQETTFIDHNGPKDAHEDIRLMSLCQHHIIANSSFSWWGAWLAKYPDKAVFAPKRWLAAEKLEIKTDEIVPSSWMRI